MKDSGSDRNLSLVTGIKHMILNKIYSSGHSTHTVPELYRDPNIKHDNHRSASMKTRLSANTTSIKKITSQ